MVPICSTKVEEAKKNTSVIEMLIFKDLNKLVDNVIDELKKEDPCDTGAIKSVKINMALHAFSLKTVGSLQNFCNVDDGEEWIKGLNGNDNLLDFEDCVYDCIEKRFSDEKLSDMLTFSTRHTREYVENYDPGIGDRILSSLKNIHSSEEVFVFVMKVTATAISGRRVVDRFQIRVGFGAYFYEENGGMFASRSIGSSSSAETRRSPLVCI